MNIDKEKKENLMRIVMKEVEEAIKEKTSTELNIEVGILENECKLQIDNARKQ